MDTIISNLFESLSTAEPQIRPSEIEDRLLLAIADIALMHAGFPTPQHEQIIRVANGMRALLNVMMEAETNHVPFTVSNIDIIQNRLASSEN